MPCPTVHFACGAWKAMTRRLLSVLQITDSTAPSVCLKLATISLPPGADCVLHSCLVGGSGAGCARDGSACAADASTRPANAMAANDAGRMAKSPNKAPAKPQLALPESCKCIIRVRHGQAVTPNFGRAF